MPIHKITPELIDEIRSTYKNITSLNLSNNEISRVENLAPLTKLVKLNLSGNKIQTFQITGEQTSLKMMIASGNIISQIGDLSAAQDLQALILDANQLDDPRQLAKLSQCKNLEQLSLRGNPITKHKQYRNVVIACLPQLNVLDGVEISSQEFSAAKKFAADLASSVESSSSSSPPQTPEDDDSESDLSAFTDTSDFSYASSHDDSVSSSHSDALMPSLKHPQPSPRPQKEGMNPMFMSEEEEQLVNQIQQLRSQNEKLKEQVESNQQSIKAVDPQASDDATSVSTAAATSNHHHRRRGGVRNAQKKLDPESLDKQQDSNDENAVQNSIENPIQSISPPDAKDNVTPVNTNDAANANANGSAGSGGKKTQGSLVLSPASTPPGSPNGSPPQQETPMTQSHEYIKTLKPDQPRASLTSNQNLRASNATASSIATVGDSLSLSADSEISPLQQKLITANSKLANVEQEHELLKQEVQQLRKNAQAAKLKTDLDISIVSQLEDAQNQILALQSSNRQYLSKMLEMQQYQDKLCVQLNEYESANQSAFAQINGVQDELKVVHAENEDLQAHLNSERVKSLNLKNAFDELLNEKASLLAQTADLNRSLEQLKQQQNDSTEAETETDSESQSEPQPLNPTPTPVESPLNHRLDAINGELKAERLSKSQLEQELSECKTMLRESEHNVLESQRRLFTLQQQSKQLNENNKILQNRIQESTDQLNNANTLLEQEQERTAQLRSQLATYQSTIGMDDNSQTSKLRELTVQHKIAVQQIQLLKAEKDQLVQANASQASSAQQSARTMEEIAYLKRRNMALEKTVQDLKTELESSPSTSPLKPDPKPDQSDEEENQPQNSEQDQQDQQESVVSDSPEQASSSSSSSTSTASESEGTPEPMPSFTSPTGILNSSMRRSSSRLNAVNRVQKERLHEMEQQNHSLQNQVVSLKSALQDEQQQLAECRDKSRQLEVFQKMAFQKFQQLQSEVESAQEEANKANTQADQLRDQLNQQKSDLEQTQQEIAQELEKTQEIESSKSQIESQVQQLQQDISDQQQTIADLQQTITDLTTELDEKKEHIAKIDPLTDELATRMKALMEQNQQQNESIQDLTTQVNTAAEQLEIATTDANDSKQALEKVNALFEKARDRIQQTEFTGKQRLSRIRDLETEIETKDEAISKLTEQLDALKQQLSDVTTEYEAYALAAEAETDRFQSLQQQDQQERNQLMNEAKEYQDRISGQLSQIKRLEDEVGLVRQQRDEATSLATKNQQLADLNASKLSQMSSNLQDTQDALASAKQNSADAIQSLNGKLSAAVQEHQQTKSSLDNQIATLQQTAQTQALDLQKEKLQAQQLAKEVNDLESKLKSAIDRHESTQSKMEEMREMHQENTKTLTVKLQDQALRVRELEMVENMYKKREGMMINGMAPGGVQSQDTHALDKKIKRLQQEKDDMENDLYTREQSVKRLKRQIGELQEDLEVAHNKIKRLSESSQNQSNNNSEHSSMPMAGVANMTTGMSWMEQQRLEDERRKLSDRLQQKTDELMAEQQKNLLLQQRIREMELEKQYSRSVPSSPRKSTSSRDSKSQETTLLYQEMMNRLAGLEANLNNNNANNNQSNSDAIMVQQLQIANDQLNQRINQLMKQNQEITLQLGRSGYNEFDGENADGGSSIVSQLQEARRRIDKQSAVIGTLKEQLRTASEFNQAQDAYDEHGMVRGFDGRDQQLAELQQTVTGQKELITELEERVKKARDLGMSLSKEVAQLKRQKEDADRALNDLQLSSQADLDRKSEQLTRVQEQHEEQVGDLKQQLADEQAMVKRLQAYYGGSISNPASAVAKSNSTKVAESQAKLDALTQERDALSKQVDLLKTRCNSLEEILRVQENEISSSEQVGESKQASEKRLISRWREKVFEMMVEHKTVQLGLQEQLDNKESLIGDYEREIEKLEASRQVLHQTAVGLQAEVEMGNAVVRQLKTQLKSNETRENEVERKLYRERELVKQAGTMLKRREQAMVKVGMDLQAGMQKVEEYMERLNFMYGRLQLLGGMMQRNRRQQDIQGSQSTPQSENVQMVTLLREEVDRVTGERDYLLKKSREDGMTMRQKIDDARRAVSEELGQAHREIEQLKGEIQSIERSMDQVKSERDRVKTLNAELKDQLDQQRERVTEVYAEMEEERKEHQQTMEATRNQVQEDMRGRELALEKENTDLRSEKMKSSVQLRNLERELEMLKTKKDAEENAKLEYLEERLAQKEIQLRNVQAERNAVLSTLRRFERLEGAAAAERETEHDVMTSSGGSQSYRSAPRSSRSTYDIGQTSHRSVASTGNTSSLHLNLDNMESAGIGVDQSVESRLDELAAMTEQLL